MTRQALAMTEVSDILDSANVLIQYRPLIEVLLVLGRSGG